VDATADNPHRRGSANFLPGARAARCVDGFHERLDAQAGAEVERFRPAAGDTVQKTSGLNRLQVVEAELMTGRDAEQAVRRMVRAGLDAAEPLATAPIIGRIEMQLVETLLAEGESAFRPVDGPVAPLANRRNARPTSSTSTRRLPPLPSGRSEIIVTQSPMTRVIGPARKFDLLGAGVRLRAPARSQIAGICLPRSLLQNIY